MKRSSQGAPEPLRANICAQPPQRQRIEAGDHQLAFGDQHALGFAQHQVRVRGGFERMRQHDQVDALAGERQLHRIRRKRGAVLERQREPERDPVGAQEIELVQAHLHRPVAEHVLGGEVELGPLPFEHVPPLRRGEPLGESGLRPAILVRSHCRYAAKDCRSMLEIVPLPAFQDNYIWTLRDGTHAAVVDPGEARPVQDYLANGRPVAGRDPRHAPPSRPRRRHRRAASSTPRCRCSDRRASPSRRSRIRSARATASRFPQLDASFSVLDIPGHTRAHVAYYGLGSLFCGDTLFACGCGRVFEGTPAQMLESLSKLAALPDETQGLLRA